jgi:hypothetical protein
MTSDSLSRALRKAERAYQHAVLMMNAAESPAAYKRHARRAQQSARTVASLRRDLARASLVLMEEAARAA